MTDPAPQTSPVAPPVTPLDAPRSGRGLRWLLVASLAFNLAFLGLVAGGAVRMWRVGPAVQPAPAAELQLLWRALPDEDRRAMRGGDGQARQAEGRDVQDRRHTRDEMRTRLAGDVAALRALLLAEPFDRTALQERLTRARDIQAERSERALARMLDRIEAMAPDERARMVDRMERRMSRHMGREGRRDRD